MKLNEYGLFKGAKRGAVAIRSGEARLAGAGRRAQHPLARRATADSHAQGHYRVTLPVLAPPSAPSFPRGFR